MINENYAFHYNRLKLYYQILSSLILQQWSNRFTRVNEKKLSSKSEAQIKTLYFETPRVYERTKHRGKRETVRTRLSERRD